MAHHYGFIGGGNMATALLSGALKHALCSPADILVSDVSKERLDFLSKDFGVAISSRNAEVVKGSQVIVLAVKPQTLKEVAPEIAPALKADQTVLSILAGVPVATLQERLNGHGRIVRAMPNLPATIGQGVTALALTPLTPEAAYEVAEKLLATVGGTLRVEEELIDAVTALSGSGPGYIFRIAEILVRAGVEAGLTEEQSAALVTRTLEGAAQMLAQSSETAAELCRKVCSPGGTTLAGLERMEKNGLEEALIEGVLAARDRARELSKG